MQQSVNKAQFCMSLLMPAFKTSPIPLESSKNKHSIYNRLQKTVENQLDSCNSKKEEKQSNYELFALVPLKELGDKGLQDILKKYQNPEIAVRLQTVDSELFNLRNFEDILVCKEKT